jgi:hypothetical protein
MYITTKSQQSLIKIYCVIVYCLNFILVLLRSIYNLREVGICLYPLIPSQLVKQKCRHTVKQAYMSYGQHTRLI